VKVKVASVCGTTSIYDWDQWPPRASSRACPRTSSAECRRCRRRSHHCEGRRLRLRRDALAAAVLSVPHRRSSHLPNVKIIASTKTAPSPSTAHPESNSGDRSSIPPDYVRCSTARQRRLYVLRRDRRLLGRNRRLRTDWTLRHRRRPRVGATQIFALEPNQHRAGLAKKMKADVVIDPTTQDAKQIILDGTTASVLMWSRDERQDSRHPNRLRHPAPGGRCPCWVPSKPVNSTWRNPSSLRSDRHRHPRPPHVQDMFQMQNLLKPVRSTSLPSSPTASHERFL